MLARHYTGYPRRLKEICDQAGFGDLKEDIKQAMKISL